MFEQLRDSLRGLSARLTPDERRRVASSMREALVHAKLAMQDLRAALATTEARLAEERGELQTAQRRQQLAAGIGDEETARIAARFAHQHAERVQVLEAKRMAQQQEVALHERELADMSAQLRLAMSGVAPTADALEREAMREVEAAMGGGDADPFGAVPGAGTRDPLADAPPRKTRAEREADAEARLAALKRQMGK
jgi:hypothetical protein